MLLDGLLGTLGLSALALATALPAGLALAAWRLFGGRLAFIAVAIIEFLRTTPALVQLFWIFYALPILIGVRLEAFHAAFIALSLYTAAFMAEIFRAGIESVERGQWDAAKALGMNWLAQMRRVVVPQAVQRMLPPLVNQAIELTKTTSLVATIAYADLLYNALVLASQTFRPLEIFTGVALVYFVILTALSLAAGRLERRFAAGRA